MKDKLIMVLIDDILYLEENEDKITRYNQMIIKRRILNNALKIKDYVKNE